MNFNILLFSLLVCMYLYTFVNDVLLFQFQSSTFVQYDIHHFMFCLTCFFTIIILFYCSLNIFAVVFSWWLGVRKGEAACPLRGCSLPQWTDCPPPTHGWQHASLLPPDWPRLALNSGRLISFTKVKGARLRGAPRPDRRPLYSAAPWLEPLISHLMSTADKMPARNENVWGRATRAETNFTEAHAADLAVWASVNSTRIKPVSGEA